MYTPKEMHVPEKYHGKIKLAVTQDLPVSVKLDLLKEGNHTILLTPGQIIKIQRAISIGKKVFTIRMSKKQVRANLSHTGGFLSFLASLASKALPVILGGLTSGLLSGVAEKAISGNGLFLGKRGKGCAKIDFTDGGMHLTPVKSEQVGLHLRNDGEIHGEGILLGPNSPFKNIPLLNLIL